MNLFSLALLEFIFSPGGKKKVTIVTKITVFNLNLPTIQQLQPFVLKYFSFLFVFLSKWLRHHHPLRAKNNFLRDLASWLIVATGGVLGSTMGGGIEALIVFPYTSAASKKASTSTYEESYK